MLGVGRGGRSQRSGSPPAEVVESQATPSRPVSGRSTPSELRWTAKVHLHLNWCIYFRTLHLGKSMLNLFISGTCPTLIEVSHTHQRYHWCPASTPKPDPSCSYWQKPLYPVIVCLYVPLFYRCQARGDNFILMVYLKTQHIGGKSQVILQHAHNTTTKLCSSAIRELGR